MNLSSVAPRLWQAFAQVLEYPHQRPTAAARECATLLESVSVEAAVAMTEFVTFSTDVPWADLEESYTSTFDLDPTCCPYVGFHLFGETYKRSVFLVRLKAHARELGIELGSELPDHVTAVLRILAASDDDDFKTELATAALLPAVRRMAGTHDDEAASSGALTPYRGVLDALRVALERCHSASARDDGEPASAGTDPGVR